jgi:hypothetical protein
VNIKGNETSRMSYIAERRQIYTGVWCRNLKGIEQLEELGTDGQMILK